MKVTFAEIQAALRARRYAATHVPGRLLVGASVVVALVAILGSVASSRGWYGRRVQPPVVTSVSIPAGASTRLERRGRFRVSVRGPAAVEIGGQEQGLRLESGQLVLANEGPAVVVEAGPQRVDVPPSATVAFEPRDGGSWRVTSVDGPAIRVDGTPAPAPRLVPAAPPVAPSAPPAEASDHAPPAMPSTGGAQAVVPPGATSSPRAPGSPAAATEVAKVHDALALLRAGNNPAGALRLLDQYDRRFPDGLLRDEVAAIRVEALLASGRLREALARLEAIPSPILDRSPRLRVVRGELRAATGRCPDALPDFAAVLSGSVSEELERRAARGQAACLSEPAPATGPDAVPQ